MSKQIIVWSMTFVAMCGLLLAAIFVPLQPSSDINGLIVREPAPTPEGMVWISGGVFEMGTAEPVPPDNPDRVSSAELPAHTVELDGFWMDATPVTNAAFARFVEATNYVTLAERKLTPRDFQERGAAVPGLPEVTPAGSMCFMPNFDRKKLKKIGPGWEMQVWEIVEGANWRHPEGPGSSIEDRMDHPVVHVACEDAVAYCQWAGKRLPTEAEFEYAARSGGKDVKYPWGDELIPDGKYLANWWQGQFPETRINEDGYLGTSPVKAFPPNEIGLYDMAGNVWEWCSDLYHENYYAVSPRRNPQGPTQSYDPLRPGIVCRVQRGGSFLCNVNNCTSYRVTARGRSDMASSTHHCGFRCVVDPTMIEEYNRRQAELSKTITLTNPEKS